MSAGGGQEAAGTRCAWEKECGGDLLNGWRFSFKLNRTVYKSYIRPFLYGCDAWLLREKRDGIFMKERGIHGDSNVCTAAQR